jgi:hypothetical protein
LKEDASVIRERDIQADRRAVNSVTPDMLQRVWSEIGYRIDVLSSNKSGAHSVCVIPHKTLSVYATVATSFVRIFHQILIL